MSNTPPLKRLQVGLAILAVIFGVAVCGYRLGGWSLTDSVYMTVTTLSMVGYRDDLGATGMTPELKVFTTVLIVFGVGKLPQVGNAIGKGIRSFRRGQAGEKDEEEEEEPGPVKKKPVARKNKTTTKKTA